MIRIPPAAFCLPGEVWKPVADWPGYAVSDFGRVASCKPCAGYCAGVWHILTPFWSGYPSKYLYIGVKDCGRSIQFRVHRLVLETFVGPRPKGLVGCHDDNDRTNNRLSNLLYKTQKANIADKERHGTKRVGSDINTSVIDEARAVAILERFREVSAFQKYGAIPIVAKEFGVTDDIVGRISRGTSWKHVCSHATNTSA